MTISFTLIHIFIACVFIFIVTGIISMIAYNKTDDVYMLILSVFTSSLSALLFLILCLIE